MSDFASHPAIDDSPWNPDADAQPEGLRIPSHLIDDSIEQQVRDGAWAGIIAGDADEVDVAAEVMLLADGAVDLIQASTIATLLLDARRQQLAGGR